MVKREINKWEEISQGSVQESATVLEKARSLIQLGIAVKDALHVACALSVSVDYFITTDRKLLSKLLGNTEIHAVSPLTFIEETQE
jgi:predicted nucleic acid-binding protein